MASRVPVFNKQRRICMICEGDEEYEYIKRLIKIGVWNKKYKVDLVNARGNGNIPARYQDKYQSGSYEAVFVFCDTDKKPYEQYEDIKGKIDEVHGKRGCSSKVVLFGNPCTMQIIILHWINVILPSHKKAKNAPYIEMATGVRCYRAREDQRRAVFSHINRENYKLMKRRVIRLSTDDRVVGSSNFNKLLSYLESEDTHWIKKLEKSL